MTKKMKKMAEIFKLEERVLFDAAAVADVVEAVQNDPAVQGQQSAEDKQAEDDRNALKNAAPENPADAAQQGAQAEEQAKAQPTNTEAVPSADPDAAVQALVEGAIPDAEQAADADADAEAEQVLPDGNADTAALEGEAQEVKADAADAQDTDVAVNGEAEQETVAADVEATADAKADDSDGNGEVAFAEAFADAEQPEAGKELVIINSSIRDQEAFIEEAGKDADILVLDASDDALDQINEFLDAHDTKYSSVHIITHGNEGYFLLSGDVVTAESVTKDPASWAAIGDHLTDGADVMIYSCNLAGNVEGQNLVDAIANLTGADVAASADITGRGGNWDFEYAIGTIDHSALFADKYTVNYDYSLASITVNADAKQDDPDKGIYRSLNTAYSSASSGDSITIVSASANMTGSITWSKEVTLASSSASRVTLTHNVAIADNTTLYITSGSFNMSSTASNPGSLDVSGDVQLSNANVNKLTVSGTVTVDNSLTANSVTVESSGTLTNKDSGSVEVAQNVLNSGTLSNSGDFAVSQGSVTNSGNLTNSGDFTVSQGNVTNENGATLTNSKTFMITAGGLTNRGSLTNSDDFTVSKDVTNNGTLTNNVGSTFTVSQGAVTNSGTLTNSGDFSVVLGDVTNSHNLTNHSVFTVSQGDLENSGTLTNNGKVEITVGNVTNSGTLTNNQMLMIGGQLNNTTDGLINRLDTSYYADILAGSMSNSGTIQDFDYLVLSSGDSSNNGGATISGSGNIIVRAAATLTNQNLAVINLISENDHSGYILAQANGLVAKNYVDNGSYGAAKVAQYYYAGNDAQLDLALNGDETHEGIDAYDVVVLAGGATYSADYDFDDTSTFTFVTTGTEATKFSGTVTVVRPTAQQGFRAVDFGLEGFRYAVDTVSTPNVPARAEVTFSNTLTVENGAEMNIRGATAAGTGYAAFAAIDQSQITVTGTGTNHGTVSGNGILAVSGENGTFTNAGGSGSAAGAIRMTGDIRVENSGAMFNRGVISGFSTLTVNDGTLVNYSVIRGTASSEIYSSATSLENSTGIYNADGGTIATAEMLVVGGTDGSGYFYNAGAVKNLNLAVVFGTVDNVGTIGGTGDILLGGISQTTGFGGTLNNYGAINDSGNVNIFAGTSFTGEFHNKAKGTVFGTAEISVHGQLVTLGGVSNGGQLSKTGDIYIYASGTNHQGVLNNEKEATISKFANLYIYNYSAANPESGLNNNGIITGSGNIFVGQEGVNQGLLTNTEQGTVSVTGNINVARRSEILNMAGGLIEVSTMSVYGKLDNQAAAGDYNAAEIRVLAGGSLDIYSDDAEISVNNGLISGNGNFTVGSQDAVESHTFPGRFTNNGTMLLTGNITVYGGAKFTNQSLVTQFSSLSIVGANATYFYNYGSLISNGDITVNNDDAELVNNSSIKLADGASLKITAGNVRSGSNTAVGEITGGKTSNIVISQKGSLSNARGSAVTVGGSITEANGGSLENYGTIDGFSSMSLNGTLVHDGDTARISGTGNVTLQSSASATGSGLVDMTGGTFTYEGSKTNALYDGRYYNLALNGDRSYVINAGHVTDDPAGGDREIDLGSVDETEYYLTSGTLVNGTLSGSVGTAGNTVNKVTFAGQTTYFSTDEANAVGTVNMTGGKVIYAQDTTPDASRHYTGIRGGTYNGLVVKVGDTEGTLNPVVLDHSITVNDKLTATTDVDNYTDIRNYANVAMRTNTAVKADGTAVTLTLNGSIAGISAFEGEEVPVENKENDQLYISVVYGANYWDVEQRDVEGVLLNYLHFVGGAFYDLTIQTTTADGLLNQGMDYHDSVQIQNNLVISGNYVTFSMDDGEAITVGRDSVVPGHVVAGSGNLTISGQHVALIGSDDYSSLVKGDVTITETASEVTLQYLQLKAGNAAERIAGSSFTIRDGSSGLHVSNITNIDSLIINSRDSEFDDLNVKNVTVNASGVAMSNITGLRALTVNRGADNAGFEELTFAAYTDNVDDSADSVIRIAADNVTMNSVHVADPEGLQNKNAIEEFTVSGANFRLSNMADDNIRIEVMNYSGSGHQTDQDGNALANLENVSWITGRAATEEQSEAVALTVSGSDLLFSDVTATGSVVLNSRNIVLNNTEFVYNDNDRISVAQVSGNGNVTFTGGLLISAAPQAGAVQYASAAFGSGSSVTYNNTNGAVLAGTYSSLQFGKTDGTQAAVQWSVNGVVSADTVNIYGDVTVAARDAETDSTLTLANATIFAEYLEGVAWNGSLTVDAGQTLELSGTLSLNDNTSGRSPAGAALVNHGTVQAAEAQTYTITLANASTFMNDGIITGSGSLTVAEGTVDGVKENRGEISLSGTITLGGEFTNTADGTISGFRSMTVNAAAEPGNLGGNLVNDGSILVGDADRAAAFTVAGGAFSGTGTLTGTGNGTTLNFNMGADPKANYGISGNVTVADGASAAFTGTSNQQKILTMAGTLTVNEGGSVTASRTAFTGAINNGGTFTASTYNTFSGEVTNNGTFEVTNGHFDGDVMNNADGTFRAFSSEFQTVTNYGGFTFGNPDAAKSETPDSTVADFINHGTLTATNIEFASLTSADGTAAVKYGTVENLLVTGGTATLTDVTLGTEAESISVTGGTLRLSGNYEVTNQLAQTTPAGGEHQVAGTIELMTGTTLNLRQAGVTFKNMVINYNTVLNVWAAGTQFGLNDETAQDSALTLIGTLNIQEDAEAHGEAVIYGFNGSIGAIEIGTQDYHSAARLTLSATGVAPELWDVTVTAVVAYNTGMLTDSGNRLAVGSLWTIVNSDRTIDVKDVGKVRYKVVNGTLTLVNETGYTAAVEGAFWATGDNSHIAVNGSFNLSGTDNGQMIVVDGGADLTVAEDVTLTVSDGAQFRIQPVTTGVAAGSAENRGTIVFDNADNSSVVMDEAQLNNQGTLRFTGANTDYTLTGVGGTIELAGGTVNFDHASAEAMEFDSLTVGDGATAFITDTVNLLNADGIGTMKGIGTVNFNGTTAGNIQFARYTNGTDHYLNVAYAQDAATVYGGTYQDLTITGDHALTNNLTVNGTATLSGEQSGTADVTFAGSTAGTGSFNMTDGTVSYGANASVYGGTYSGLAITGDHTLAQDVTVGGMLNMQPASGSKQVTLTNNAVLTLNGTVDSTAAQMAGDGTTVYSLTADSAIYGGTYGTLTLQNGREYTVGDVTISTALNVAADTVIDFTGAASGTPVINAALTSTVRYSGDNTQNVYNAANGYGNLTLQNGKTLQHDVTVNGTADFSDEVNGQAKLVFNGAVSGDAELTMADGTSVTYNLGTLTSQNVFGGTYSDLKLNGAHTLTNNFTVNGRATISGEQSGTADVRFAGSTAGTGSLNMTDGTVIYEADVAVYSGTYANLKLNGAHALTGSITVNGTANVTGEQTGTANVTFSGDTLGIGTLAMTSGTVTYGSAAGQLYGGSYANLTLAGEHTLNADLTVTGKAVSDADIPAEISAISGTVTYASSARGVFSGTYNNLTIAGNQTLSGNQIQVNGTADISGTLSGNGDVEFRGATAGSGTFRMSADSSVTYAGNSAQEIYGGTYYDLTVTGSHTFNNAVTVTGNAEFSGSMSAAANLTFSGTTNANEDSGSNARITAAAGTVVTYGANAEIYGGSYDGLVISGTHTLMRNISVDTSLSLSGVLSGTGNVTINTDTLTGGGRFDMTGGTVSYTKTASSVYGGTYYNLSLTDKHELTSALAVDGTFTLTGTASEISGTAALTLNGRVSSASATKFTYDGVVTYNGNNSSFIDGTYSRLVINNGNHLAGTLVIGSTTAGGTLTVAEGAGLTVGTSMTLNPDSVLRGAGTIRFNGTTAGTGTAESQDLNVVYSAKATLVYGGTYGNLTLVGSHTLTLATTVHGNLTVQSSDGSTATITSSGNLTVDGSLIGFNRTTNRIGVLNATGTTTLNGSNYTVDGSSFAKMEFNGSNVTFRNTTLNGAITGTGSMKIDQGVSGSAVFAEDDAGNAVSVTYTRDSGTMFSGTYNNLTLQKVDSVDDSSILTIKTDVVVTGELNFSATTLTVDNNSNLTVLAFGDSVTDKKNIVINTGSTMMIGRTEVTSAASSKKGQLSQTEAVDATIRNSGTLKVNRGNYKFAYVVNNGTFNVYDKVDMLAGNVTLTEFDNNYGASAKFEIRTIVSEAATSWINYGALEIDNYDNFGLSSSSGFKVYNYSTATLAFGNSDYTFDATHYLLNEGTVKAVKGGTVDFVMLNEHTGGNLSYVTTTGGTMNFNITAGSAVNDGVRGALVNGGEMNLNTENMHYYGAVSNAGNDGSVSQAAVPAYLTINATSVMEGDVTKNSFGEIRVAKAAAGTVFQGKVLTGSSFVIDGSTTFNKAVTAINSVEINAETVFNAAVLITDEGAAGTSAAPVTRFRVNKYTVFNENVSVVSTDHNTVLELNGSTWFNGTLTNTASSAAHLSQIVVNASSVFNEITNDGAGAEFRVYSAFNTFKEAITNTSGLFELNAANSLNSLTNTGYFRIDHAGAVSSVLTLVNSGRVAVFAGDDGEATLFEFSGTVENQASGTISLYAEGVTFRNTITNAGTLNIQATTTLAPATTGGAGIFNSGTINVKADDTTFNCVIENSGTLSVGMDIAGVVFNRDVTNTQTGTLILGGPDTVLNGTVDNYGTIKVTGGLDSDASTRGNEIKGRLIMRPLDPASTSYSVLNITSTGELSLNAVTDDWQGTAPTTEYYVKTTVETTDSTTGEITVKEDVKKVDKATYDATEETETKTETVTTTVSKYTETIMVNGNQPRMNVSDCGILRFVPQTYVQTIHSKIEVSGDGDVQFVYGKTLFTDITYTDWTLLTNNTVITAYGRYRVNDGAVVTVTGDAYGSDFRVNAGGTLNIFNGSNVNSLENQGGTVNLAGGTYTIVINNDFGTMTISSVSSVSGGLINNAVANITGSEFFGGVLNDGIMDISGSTVNVLGNTGDLTLAGTSVTLLANTNGSVSVGGGTSQVETLMNSGDVTVRIDGAAVIGSLNNEIDGSAGRMTVRGTASVTTLTDIAGSGIAVDGGTLNYSGAVSGNMEVTGGTVNGNLTLGNTVSGGNARFNGTVNYAGSSQNVIGGTYRQIQISGSNTQIAGDVTTGTLDIQSGLNVTQSGSLNVTQVLSGTIAGNAGSVTTAGNAAVTANSGVLNVGGAAAVANNSGVLNASGAAAVTVNSGVLNANGAAVVATNSGVLNGHGTVRVNINTNTVNAYGNAEVTGNNGTVNVLGNNVTLTGRNSGMVTVSGTGAVFAMTSGNAAAGLTVNQGGSVALTPADNFNAVLTNRGTVNLDQAGIGFARVVNNGGTIRVNTDQSASLQKMFNAGGTIQLNVAAVLDGMSVANGTTVVLNNADILAENLSRNDGTVAFNYDDALDQEIQGSGTVAVIGGHELTLNMAAARSNYRTDSGSTLALSGDMVLTGTVSNYGTVAAAGNTVFDGVVNNFGTVDAAGDVTFSGITNGTGTVTALNSAVVYGANAANIFGGRYADLTVNSNGTVTGNALVDRMMLRGSLALGSGVTVTFNGALNGNGTMDDSLGTVVYGAGVTDDIYTGNYHNVVFENAAVLDGDMTVTGDALLGAAGSFRAENGTVTYRSALIQRVAEGEYDNLMMFGSGAKVMTAGSFSEVHGMLTVHGTTEALTPMISSDPDVQYTMRFAANDAYFHYAYIEGLRYIGFETLNLDGTNRLGNNVLNVDTFNAAGGIGYSFPDMTNQNFTAATFSLADEIMNANAYESQLLNEFRRYRGELQASVETAEDMSIDSGDEMFSGEDVMPEDAVSQMFLEDIPAEDVRIENGDVVAASAAFQDDLDKALETILKA